LLSLLPLLLDMFAKDTLKLVGQLDLGVAILSEFKL